MSNEDELEAANERVMEKVSELVLERDGLAATVRVHEFTIRQVSTERDNAVAFLRQAQDRIAALLATLKRICPSHCTLPDSGRIEFCPCDPGDCAVCDRLRGAESKAADRIAVLERALERFSGRTPLGYCDVCGEHENDPCRPGCKGAITRAALASPPGTTGAPPAEYHAQGNPPPEVMRLVQEEYRRRFALKVRCERHGAAVDVPCLENYESDETDADWVCIARVDLAARRPTGAPTLDKVRCDCVTCRAHDGFLRDAASPRVAQASPVAPPMCACGIVVSGDRTDLVFDKDCSTCLGTGHAPPQPVRSTWMEPCPECGHRHAGPQLGGICIGCPCQYTPGLAEPPRDPGEKKGSAAPPEPGKKT